MINYVSVRLLFVFSWSVFCPDLHGQLGLIYHQSISHNIASGKQNEKKLTEKTTTKQTNKKPQVGYPSTGKAQLEQKQKKKKEVKV